MRNFLKRLRRRKADRTEAAASGDTTERFERVAVVNHLAPVARPIARGWEIVSPPVIRFTGRTTTGAGIREWAKANRMELSFGVDPDLRFAELEATSAVQACLWLKRFNQDTGYRYEVETRDCDNFARRARAFPDLFSDPLVAAQAAVFGIYAEMGQPFAGITDGVHALNAVWTDRGVYVFEPQGLNLIYQRLESWPNRHGISTVLAD